ncbi:MULTISPECIES: hydrogenase maturation nickel metallochaperone HypA [Fundidesulfovibrio]|uniref:hydrogenase maturation nickel metallochaperone HypA n=1 Tax=Fundidesulfovibrio TaxID=2905136 RepID=UPI001FAC2F88|nr:MULTISPECIES: hydrogenase maturation nickel metallochaperone HypA [Fundidesulfovibrio]
MHESSLASSIIAIAEDTARKGQGGRIVQVDMCIGELACVEEETLRSCFEMLSEGTLAHGARMVVERKPATGRCTSCGGTARKAGRLLRCPDCTNSFVTLETGRELFVKSIEVERPNQEA